MVPAGWNITRETVFYRHPAHTLVPRQTGMQLYDQSESIFLPEINRKPLVQVRWVLEDAENLQICSKFLACLYALLLIGMEMVEISALPTQKFICPKMH